jgi:hypothetical protein
MKCDICKEKILGNFVDGKTVFGPWAIMCPSCFKERGVGLGTGKGQEFNSKRVKVKG